MKQQRLNHIIEALQADEVQLQKTKCQDYADVKNDALSNFKEAAAFAGITPLQACAVYIFKHICAISAYVKGHTDQTDDIEERLLDLRVYMALFYALDEEERHSADRIAVGEISCAEWSNQRPG